MSTTAAIAVGAVIRNTGKKCPMFSSSHLPIPDDQREREDEPDAAERNDSVTASPTMNARMCPG